MKSLLILICALSVRAPVDSPAVVPALPARVELGQEDPRDAEERTYRAFVVNAGGRGRLFVTASSTGSAVVPDLRIATTPPSEVEVVTSGPSLVLATVDVSADQELEVRVYGAATDGVEAVLEMSASLAVETDDTAARARRVFEGVNALGLGEGAPSPEVAERLAALVDELAAPDAEAFSPLQHYVATRLNELPEAAIPATLAVRLAEILHRYSERNLPATHPDRRYAAALYGYSLEGVGRLEEARVVQAALVDTLASLATDDDPAASAELMEAQLNYGGTLFRLGDLRGAMEIFKPLHAVVSRTRAPGDPLFEGTRRSYAAGLLEQGRVQRAAELLRAQLTDLAVDAEPDALSMARAQRDLARALLEIGDLVAAERRIKEAWAVLSTVLPPRDPERVRARVLQGQVLLAAGDLLSAAMTLEDALAEMDPNAPERPVTQHSLARIRIEMGQLDVGRALLDTLIESLPGDHPQRYAARLDRLKVNADERDLASLRDELETLQRDAEGAEQPDEDLLALIQENLGWVLSEQGGLDAAQPLSEDTLARLEERLPESHPRVHEARLNLAWIQVRRNRLRPAGRAIRDVVDGIETRLRQTGAGRGTRELEALAVQSARSLGEILSLLALADDPDWREPLEEEAFSLVEGLRNVSADRRRLTGAAARGDADLEPWVEAVRAAAAEVVRRSWAGSDDLFEAVQAHDAAERALFAELAEREPELVRSRTASAASVGEALALDEAAVSYWRYVRTELEPGSDRALPPRDHYLAYVLRPGEPLRRIELGDAAEIDGAVDRWRRAILDGIDRGLRAAHEEAEGPSPGEALRALVLDPLRDALGDATTLQVAFDDALHTVPFDALPTPEGGCVGDGLRIVSRTSLRELTRAGHHAPATAPRLLALGGLEYEKEPVLQEPLPGAEALAALTRRSAPPWLKGRGFKYLYDSKDEAIDVERQFGRAHEDGSTELLVGQEGSRVAFELAAPEATHLHLATHAYFAPQSIPSSREARGGGGVGPATTDLRDQVRGFAPQVLCGLAFAGANLPPSDEDPFPRVMTAGELMTLDLSNCELAVLSACDTSVGVRRAGQGVASLQQALHAAGARSMITSLWEVPDAATRKLMEEFYFQLWEKGASKADALWRAKCSLRDEFDGDRPRYSRRAWAGWVLSGDGG